MTRSYRAIPYLSAAIFGVACSSQVTGSHTPGKAPPPSPTLVGTTPVPTTMGTVTLPAAGALGPLALRRLNTVEYENTVQDVLKVAAGTTSTFREDDPGLGYKNMAVALTVTPLLAEKYAATAKKLATALDLNQFAPCANAAAEAACAEAFISTFGRGVFRRPVTTEEITGYSAIFADKRTRSDYAGGVRLVAETMLQSPHFLYKTEIGDGTGVDRALTQYELASQISYLATGAPPDAELATAADGGKLGSTTEREAQLRRLLGSDRSKSWLTSFVTQWLGIADAGYFAKDRVVFPSYTPTLSVAVAEESQRFVESILTQSNASLEALFTANWTISNGELGAHYAVQQAPADWQQVTLPAEQRLGILTQSAFLVANSKAADSFPIRRGKTIRTRILCGDVPPPPADLKVVPVELDPTLTTRERFQAHEKSGSVCAACHSLMDPLGFAFENYDATGAYRTIENKKPVDASGAINAISPEIDGPFANALELSRRIAPSKVLKDCVARESMRWAIGRETMAEPATDPKVLRDQAIIGALSARLATTNSDIRELFLALVQRDEFAFRSDQ